MYRVRVDKAANLLRINIEAQLSTSDLAHMLADVEVDREHLKEGYKTLITLAKDLEFVESQEDAIDTSVFWGTLKKIDRAVIVCAPDCGRSASVAQRILKIYKHNQIDCCVTDSPERALILLER